MGTGMEKRGLVLEINFTDSRSQSVRPPSRLSAFVEGFARAFDPAPAEQTTPFIRDDAAAIRADLRVITDGLAKLPTQRLAG